MVVTTVDGIHVPEGKLAEQGRVDVDTTVEGGRVVRPGVDETEALCPVTSNVLVKVGMVLHEDIVRGNGTRGK